jgi:hypothetical protein
MAELQVPVAPGELIDKLTILRLKAENISDPQKRAHVLHEQSVLQAVADAGVPGSPELKALWAQLYQINKDLWQIEDDIRACEARQDFGDNFIQLARAVYVTNDKRAQVKKEMNLLLGSAIVEEKSYHSTDPS